MIYGMIYIKYNNMWICYCNILCIRSRKGGIVKRDTLHLFFYKQLGLDFSPQSCLYFQNFQGSKLLNGYLVVWPSNLCLGGIQ